MDVVSRCGVFGSGQLRLGKAVLFRKGGVRPGTARLVAVSQGGLDTVCYG